MPIITEGDQREALVQRVTPATATRSTTAAAGMHGRGKATVHAQRDVRVHGPVHQQVYRNGTADENKHYPGVQLVEACSRRPRTVPLGA